MRTLSLLALALLSSNGITAEVPLKTAQLLADGATPVKIVCIGDSITGVYYHSGGLRAYPEMLEIALRKVYPKSTLSVRNAGISGDTTAGALKRLDRDVLSHHPDLVTIMFGMNDLVRIPLPTFKENLKNIIRQCRGIGAEVILCTQDSVIETPQRPSAKLAEFTQVIRDTAREESLLVADCYAAYEAVRARNPDDWELLHSDAIHPNMDGHKLFASVIAETITGQEVSLKEVGPPLPALQHTHQLLLEKKPVTVLAMPPYDKLIAPALHQLFPDATVTVNTWSIEGQTLAQLEVAARKVRSQKQDLVVIAVPASAQASNLATFHHDYAWIMNGSLSFGPQQWDVVVASPSTAKPELTPEERQQEALAHRLITAQDLHLITRADGDATPTLEVLTAWLKQHLLPTPK